MSQVEQSTVDIPDFLQKPQETRVTLIADVLQEFIRHAYQQGIITGWLRGFLTGSLVPLIIGAVLMTLGII